MKFTRQAGFKQEAVFAADLVDVRPHQLRAPKWTAARLIGRGVGRAVGLPLVWIAWRYSVHHGHDYIE